MNLLKTTLENGLTVVLRETHSAPVASVWVWYHVGSRNEHLGITGISHWVEHMMFKGTERWPRQKLDQAIAREGGYLNAMTWYDFTAYFETLPSAKAYMALDIESDRMTNALFDPDEVAAERTVIISERQGNENDPTFVLDEELSGAAFRVHPYGHDTIGHLCDLQTMTREDLYTHYRTYYAPNNAILAAAGDFNAGEMLRMIERTFGKIAPRDTLPQVTAQEPPQKGERRVTIEGDAGTDYLALAFHTPEATHPDIHALTILSTVLAGGSGSLVGRGSLTNYTSRLYRAVVQSEIAADVSASLIPSVDPNLYRISATVLPEHSPAEVENAIRAEINTIRTTPITAEELAKAKRQARALFAFSSESITNQAFWLGYSEIFADTSWFLRYLEKLETVTIEDVLRVADTYLRPQNITVGHYLSNQGEH